MRLGMLVLGLTMTALAAQPLEAQRGRDDRGRSERGPDRIPPGHMPAPGECRVWVDGVPPGRQAAPTDCATARRRAAQSGGRVVYGGDRDDDRRDRRGDDRGSEGDWCLDRDRDGICDSAEGNARGRDDSPWRLPERRDGACVDRDRDGRCDGRLERIESIGLPEGRPRMSSALDFDRGVRSSEVERWVGRAAHDVRIARFLNRPVSATFYDRDGRILQRWKRPDDQGRIRQIEVYQNGRLVRTVDR